MTEEGASMISSDIEDNIFDEEIDLSEITGIEEQKEFCGKMLRVLELEEKRLRKRFVNTQTLNDFVETSPKTIADLTQFVGYNYGTINQCMVLIDSAVVNLQRFQEGMFDDVDENARSMFISLWYNLGLSHVDMINSSMKELEELEKDVLERLTEKAERDGDDLVVTRGVVH